MSTAFIHGTLLAFGLILPLGAQNVFIFNQGSAHPNFRAVIPVIVTASLCDTLLILSAVCGVSVMVLSMPALQTVILAAGVIFLTCMGLAVWREKPATDVRREAALPARKQMLFAVSVSLLNPHALLDTIGVIGANSLLYSGQEKAAFTAAAIAVSWLWFCGLAAAGRLAASMDRSGRGRELLNKGSAVLIWLTAAYMVRQLYRGL